MSSVNPTFMLNAQVVASIHNNYIAQCFRADLSAETADPDARESRCGGRPAARKPPRGHSYPERSFNGVSLEVRYMAVTCPLHDGGVSPEVCRSRT